MNKIPISLLFATGRVGSPVVTDGVNVKLADDPSVFPDTLSRSQQQLTQRIQVVEQSVQSIQLNLDTLLPDVAGVKNLSIKNSESASTLHQQVHQHAGILDRLTTLEYRAGDAEQQLAQYDSSIARLDELSAAALSGRLYVAGTGINIRPLTDTKGRGYYEVSSLFSTENLITTNSSILQVQKKINADGSNTYELDVDVNRIVTGIRGTKHIVASKNGSEVTLSIDDTFLTDDGLTTKVIRDPTGQFKIQMIWPKIVASSGLKVVPYPDDPDAGFSVSVRDDLVVGDNDTVRVERNPVTGSFKVIGIPPKCPPQLKIRPNGGLIVNQRNEVSIDPEWIINLLRCVCYGKAPIKLPTSWAATGQQYAAAEVRQFIAAVASDSTIILPDETFEFDPTLSLNGTVFALGSRLMLTVNSAEPNSLVHLKGGLLDLQQATDSMGQLVFNTTIPTNASLAGEHTLSVEFADGQVRKLNITVLGAKAADVHSMVTEQNIWFDVSQSWVRSGNIGSTASWLWDNRDFADTQQIQEVRLGAVFTNSAARKVEINATADSMFTLFLDGVKIMESNNWAELQTKLFDLPQGQHVFLLSAYAKSASALDAGFLFTMRDAVTKKELLVSSPDNWYYQVKA